MVMLTSRLRRILSAIWLCVPHFIADVLFGAKVLITLSFLLTSLTVTPQISEGSSFDISDFRAMSLEELLRVKITSPAAITKLTGAEIPGSITVISAKDIQHTPARNIYDLIETYVPGAIWMNYEDGPQLGIRGIITNRNFKYLLRINGRVMNNKAHYGAKSELEQWDMSDIQRIEIVRGPGSVTYGPGAVAGIINIITHNADSVEGLKIGARYVDKYDSKGLSVSHGYRTENFGLYAFGSITRTSGYDARQFLGTNDQEAGYIGEDILLDKEPLDYFADYQDDPQIKLYVDADFLDHWRFWLRYTQEGSTWRGNEVKTDFNGRLLDQQGVRDRQWTATLQYDNELRKDISISAMLSVDSSDVERRRENVYHPDHDHALNKEIDFSEDEIFFRTIVNWQTAGWVEIALGVEYSWNQFGPGWGDSNKDMRIGERGVIISGPSSNALEPGSNGSADRWGTEIFADDGWNTDTYSFFSEANVSLRPWLKAIISGRADKNTYSDWLFSPRVALISNVADGHYLKLIVQRSLRMDTAGQLYVQSKNDNKPDSESLTGVELIYSAFPSDRISFSLSGFWNDMEVIAWNLDIQSTSLVGDLQLYGIEPEIECKWSSGKVGASYSYVKQLDWELADGVPASGISYSDFNLQLEDSDAVQLGLGNDLNNWPNQALKFFGQVAITDKMTLHADARILWDFQGQKDGLEALRRAVAGTSDEAAVKQAIRKVEDADTYDYDFRLNSSISYALRKDLTIQIFAQNLLGENGNKRYSYDYSGTSKPGPHRVRFVEEPRTYGIRIDYRY
jgi:outer membrane receptor protein involved in Fe transport